ncbi:VTT domain-containing protein [Candidatus Kaiserbacteria bacterium]|nr:VTT domain-containing protein [Candidatus Kaiserbacteria bacterium]
MEEKSRIRKILESKHVEKALGLFSFAESSFLPVFADPVLIAVVIAKPLQWMRLAFITTVTSVLGGVFGYLIGYVFFDTIGQGLIATYGLEEVFAKTQNIFDGNVIVFTLIGALTPLPYKLVAITGGLLKINMLLFILASIAGRAFRFYVVAYVTKTFGEQVLQKLTWRFSLGATALLIGLTAYAVLLVV